MSIFAAVEAQPDGRVPMEAWRDAVLFVRYFASRLPACQRDLLRMAREASRGVPYSEDLLDVDLGDAPPTPTTVPIPVPAPVPTLAAATAPTPADGNSSTSILTELVVECLYELVQWRNLKLDARNVTNPSLRPEQLRCALDKMSIFTAVEAQPDGRVPMEAWRDAVLFVRYFASRLPRASATCCGWRGRRRAACPTRRTSWTSTWATPRPLPPPRRSPCRPPYPPTYPPPPPSR
mmetsp:Transcript_71949/g.192134  ORF Transcript_71949/g.192134 Transcript_71949/m.192134 type:complete len:235 (-) Transcript_71949:18-722(-)